MTTTSAVEKTNDGPVCQVIWDNTKKGRGRESKKSNFQIKEKKKNSPNNNEMKLEK